jgi:rubrerythrin
MKKKLITLKDMKLAENCLKCPVCKTARRKQRGFAFWFVKKIEHGVCPSCRAYEKVYGRKAYEPESLDVK